MKISSEEYQRRFRAFYKENSRDFCLVARQVCQESSSPDAKILELCKQHLWNEGPYPYKLGTKLSDWISKAEVLNFFTANHCKEWIAQEQFMPTEIEDGVYRTFHDLQKKNQRFFANVQLYFQGALNETRQAQAVTQFLLENDMLQKTRSLVTREEKLPGLACETYRTTYDYTIWPILQRMFFKKAGSQKVVVIHPYKKRVYETFEEIANKIGEIFAKKPEIFQILMSSLYRKIDEISLGNKELLYKAEIMEKVGEQYEWREPPELMKLCGYWDWKTHTYKLVEKVEGCSDLGSSYAKLSSELHDVCSKDKELTKQIGFNLCFNRVFAPEYSQIVSLDSAKLWGNNTWKYPGLMLHCIRHNVWHEKLSVRNPLETFIAKNLEEKFMKIFKN